MIKLEKVINILDSLNVDALLVSDGYNIRYLSGFTGATGYLFISRTRQIIFTDFRYTIQANAESIGCEVIEITNAGYNRAINDLVKIEGINKLGFEDNHMLYSDFIKIKDDLLVKELIPVGDSITNIRIIKDQEEIELIGKAQSIGDIAFSKILDVIKPGITEIEIAAHLEFLLKMNGAQGLSFDTIVASGVNSSMPHATPSYKTIEQGDFITMDFGCIYKGYCSDMTRTIVVGKATKKQKDVYSTVLEAQLAALDFLKAGYKGKEIDKIARDIIKEAGYGDYFGHGLGHSVGLYIHENPRLSLMEEEIILANTIETVEPGIYIKDFGGVRIEDLVLVTEDGHVNLTHSPKELIEL